MPTESEHLLVVFDPDDCMHHTAEEDHLMCNFSFTRLLLMQFMLQSKFLSQFSVLQRIGTTHIKYSTVSMPIGTITECNAESV